jgi:hypothetical protein
MPVGTQEVVKSIDQCMDMVGPYLPSIIHQILKAVSLPLTCSYNGLQAYDLGSPQLYFSVTDCAQQNQKTKNMEFGSSILVHRN